MDDLIGEFISETSESLAALERTLGDHARTPMTRDGWDMAYRLMHTIKGTCGFLGFTQMEQVADRSERLLATVRDQGTPPEPAQLSDIHGAMAQISAMMEHLATHGKEPAQTAPVQTAPAPRPAMVPVSEQLHRAPESPTAPSQALQHRATEPGEQIGFATLATLVTLRNQLRDIARGKVDARIAAAAATLDTLIADMKSKLMPRPKHAPVGPRLVKVLMLECGGQRFALAQSAIREIARIDVTERLAQLPTGAMVSLHGHWLPRVSLSQRLGQGHTAHEAYALVLELGESRIALGVEHIAELEELVVQPVPRMLRNKTLYEGAAILGDGTPCLLLDPTALLAQQPVAAPAPAITAPPPPPPPLPSVVEPPPAPMAKPVVQPAPPPPPKPAAAPVSKQIPFLLFGDGSHQPKAIPLQHVARVEHVQAEQVEQGPRGPQFKCRGEMLQLKLLPDVSLPTAGDFPLIMLLDAPSIGIVATRMNGIIDAEVTLPAGNPHELILTRAVIDNTATDIVNPAYFTEAAHA